MFAVYLAFICLELEISSHVKFLLSFVMNLLWVLFSYAIQFLFMYQVNAFLFQLKK